MTLRKCRVHGGPFPMEHFRVDPRGYFMCREAERRRWLRFDQSAAGKKRFQRYNVTESGRARWFKYDLTEPGRARFTRYSISEKGHARDFICRMNKRDQSQD